MLTEVCEVLQEHKVDDSVFFRTEKEWETWESKPTTWPSESADWDTWVWHVERRFEGVWKRLGLYDVIIFSTVGIPCDRYLLAEALCFWSSVTNSLELQFSALSLTIINVAAIVGLSPYGEHPTFSEHEFAICFYRKYPSYIAVNLDRVSSDDEANRSTTFLAWKSAISMRDLFSGAMSTRSLKCGVELYSPTYFSHQLGYYQAVPAPIPESSNRSRIATSRCSAEYEKWWAKYVASQFAQDVEKAKVSTLAGNTWAQEKNKTTKGTKRSNSSTKASTTNSEQAMLNKCANPKRRKVNKVAKGM
ncbi:hypothetical protein M0R45_030945 [Rubus argutus]|uniref:Aminotransferase-like plant mobile domain-containing protein n=1 Tax=Rubus argutus TaxID=59490 RepID=A0AAW1WFT0_RUBAR